MRVELFMHFCITYNIGTQGEDLSTVKVLQTHRSVVYASDHSMAVVLLLFLFYQCVFAVITTGRFMMSLFLLVVLVF